MIARALVIVNPHARRAARAVGTVRRAFARRGVDADLVLTERRGHARELAQALAGQYDAVFSLGGDGTAMEVLEVATALGRPVGVLPGGTGNLVARALGTPLGAARAVDALLDGEARRIDLGRLDDGRSFAFGAGVGVDVTMLERATTERKRRLGVFAYVVSAVDAALRHEAFEVVATVDGVRHTFDASAVMVLNFGTVLGGLLQLAPRVDPADGVLDRCVFAPRSLAQVLDTGWRIVAHRLDEGPHMHFLQGRRIVVEAAPPRMAQADGELLGPTPLSVEVRPHGALVLAPVRR